VTARRRTAASVGGTALALLAADAPAALAHDDRPLAPHDLWSAWAVSPEVTLPVVALASLYAVGVARLWARSAPGRGIRPREAFLFAAGWLALAVAVISPLHALGGVLFSAHMTQHELLMVVAAPLLVLGRPLVAFVWALPKRWRRSVGRWARQSWVRAPWRVLTRPAVASAAHAAALGVWHLPGPYEATYYSAGLHALQHVSFLSTALLFWWALLRPAPGGEGESVAWLFVASLLTGALGALLAFAPELWYPHYAATTGPWGLTPIDDQQLGGVIMWVPGGGSYLLAALVLFGLWLRNSDRRVQRRAHVAIPISVLLVVLAACDRSSRNLSQLAGGDPRRGEVAIRTYGCGSCHTIRGIRGANGLVGPPLTGIAERGYVGGVLTNTPENLIRWIQNPPSVDPMTAMPNVGATYQDAVDIAGYLYSRK
jgi:putative membrane protein